MIQRRILVFALVFVALMSVRMDCLTETKSMQINATCTVMRNGTPVVGKTVTFQADKTDSKGKVITGHDRRLTAVTNNYGKAFQTFTYDLALTMDGHDFAEGVRVMASVVDDEEVFSDSQLCSPDVVEDFAEVFLNITITY